MILTLALNRPQLPLALVPLFGADGQFALTVAMTVVKVAFVGTAVAECILAHAELAAVHKLALKCLIVALIKLFAPPMLQVFRPQSLIKVSVFLVLVLAFP